MDGEGVPVWSPSQAAAQREAKRRPVFCRYMNLWPFVGVLLALLMAFMGVPVVHSFAPADLPSALHATAQPRGAAQDAMKVCVTRDGRVFFRSDRLQPKSLPFLISNAIEEGAEKKVYIAVDSRAKYGDAAAVVNEISNAGIREICILAYKLEE
ncbi:MAG TPA: biopolymer transporter ExbD [Candidatus Acidoferrum sp.]|nr:biopolymer transporter ExbD [Candidatus Acidoferrum sp.]